MKTITLLAAILGSSTAMAAQPQKILDLSARYIVPYRGAIHLMVQSVDGHNEISGAEITGRLLGQNLRDSFNIQQFQEGFYAPNTSDKIHLTATAVDVEAGGSVRIQLKDSDGNWRYINLHVDGPSPRDGHAAYRTFIVDGDRLLQVTHLRCHLTWSGNIDGVEFRGPSGKWTRKIGQLPHSAN